MKPILVRACTHTYTNTGGSILTERCLISPPSHGLKSLSISTALGILIASATARLQNYCLLICFCSQVPSLQWFPRWSHLLPFSRVGMQKMPKTKVEKERAFHMHTSCYRFFFSWGWGMLYGAMMHQAAGRHCCHGNQDVVPCGRVT